MTLITWFKSTKRPVLRNSLWVTTQKTETKNNLQKFFPKLILVGIKLGAFSSSTSMQTTRAMGPV